MSSLMSLAYLRKGRAGPVDEIKLKKAFDRYKFPLLVLLAGIILMLFSGSDGPEYPSGDSDTLVAHILSSTQGVGKAEVLISDKGVVVVCQGADNARVRLEIIKAVGSYTGYSSDKITVLKMAK